MTLEKERINIIFLGHEKTGKSTIIDYFNDKRARLTKDAIEFESRYEYLEKITKIETSKYKIVMFDHSDSIRNIVPMTSQSDVAVIVIDSTHCIFENCISENGLTFEHSTFVYEFGINQLIIAVNKMDDESVNYSKERFDEIKAEMTKILLKVGFEQSQFKFVPISGLGKDNLIEKSSNLSWWTDGTLLETIESFKPKERPIDKPFRFVIKGVFKISGVGTIAYGLVHSGTAKIGMEIIISPFDHFIYISKIGTDKEWISKAEPGQFCGLKLYMSASDIKRGHVCGEKIRDPPKKCTNFTAKLIIIEDFDRIHAGYEAYISIHTCNLKCKFVKLVTRIDRNHDNKVTENPEWIQKGDIAIVVIEPLKPISVEAFEDYPELSHFVVADRKVIVAIGTIQSVNKE